MDRVILKAKGTETSLIEDIFGKMARIEIGIMKKYRFESLSKEYPGRYELFNYKGKSSSAAEYFSNTHASALGQRSILKSFQSMVQKTVCLIIAFQNYQAEIHSKTLFF